MSSLKGFRTWYKNNLGRVPKVFLFSCLALISLLLVTVGYLGYLLFVYNNTPQAPVMEQAQVPPKQDFVKAIKLGTIATVNYCNPKRSIFQRLFTNFRPVYPYSVVPGGICSVDELKTAMANDPIINKYYAEWDLNKVHFVQLTQEILRYAACRIGNRIGYSKKKLRIRKGELLLTDGKHFARSRCGNGLLPELPGHNLTVLPPIPALDRPFLLTVPHFAIWLLPNISENTVPVPVPNRLTVTPVPVVTSLFGGFGGFFPIGGIPAIPTTPVPPAKKVPHPKIAPPPNPAPKPSPKPAPPPPPVVGVRKPPEVIPTPEPAMVLLSMLGLLLVSISCARRRHTAQ